MQGDVVSPYRFVLEAEILSILIRECGGVKGLGLRGREVKISQYADYTTLFLRSEKHAVQKGIGYISLVKIGDCRARSLVWEGQYELEWTSEFEALCNVFDVNDLGNITELNITRKLHSMKNNTKTWKCRSLTYYGKVAVIKCLVIRKISHLLLALPSPRKILIKELKNFLLTFYGIRRHLDLEKGSLKLRIMKGA